MKKGIIYLLSLCVLGSATIAFADDDDWDDDDYHHRNYYHRYYDDDDYNYWRHHGDYDHWKSRRYKRWYSKCYRYSNIECSFKKWHDHDDWDDDDWEDYWKHHRYNNCVRRPNCGKRVLRDVVDTILWW